MTGAVHPDLTEIARRVRVVDARTVLIDDTRHRRRAPEHTTGGSESTSEASPGGDPEQPAARDWLAALLYEECYVRAAPPLKAGEDVPDTRHFREALSRANCGTGSWDTTWTYEAKESVHHVARWRKVRFRVPEGALRADATDLATGSRCWVRVPSERLNLHPGFYFVLGESPWSMGTAEEEPLVRVYWNVRHGGAASLVRTLSTGLNRSGVPFCAKVPDSPRGYGRADAGVLYLPATSFRGAWGVLVDVHAEVERHLTDAVPMFTARIARGVGVAEDPRTAPSFGQDRCSVVARALWRAHAERRQGSEEQLELIAQEFLDGDLDPTRPFLAASSSGAVHADELLRPLAAGARRPGPARPAGSRPPEAEVAASPDRPPYRSVAVRIGEALTSSAYWNRDEARCTWMGRRTVPGLGPGEVAQGSSATLGPDVYNGGAGVALFLAELYAHTAREEFRQTAWGALAGAHHRLRRGQTTVDGPAQGFYSGPPGISYTAWRVHALTGRSASGDGPVPVVPSRAAAHPAAGPGEADDLVSGRSGAILALLALGEGSGLEGVTDQARALGEDLMTSMSEHARLTGLAHGAAGHGLALFALYARTGREDFLTAARSALAFEDALFDDDAQNWPDLRPSLHAVSDEEAPRYLATWCNGAAGIALSRLYAMTVDPTSGADHDRRARIALTATERELDSLLDAGTNLSLCHGIAGLAETLWVAGTLLDDPRLGTVADTALTGWLRRWGTDERAYHRLVRSNPGLMVGAAGLGYQCLRMDDPGNVPSLLAGPWLPSGAASHATDRRG